MEGWWKDCGAPRKIQVLTTQVLLENCSTDDQREGADGSGDNGKKIEREV